MQHNIAFIAFSTLSLVACVGDNTEQQAPVVDEPDALARTCADIAAANPNAKDGDYRLYVDSDIAHSYRVYCADMDASPKEYLTLPKGGDMTWSSFRAGGLATGTDVETRFDKVRIDPLTLKLDIGDLTFAVTTGALSLPSGQVTAMPLGVAMTCGGGYATAQLDVTGTPFTIVDQFATAGDAGHVGHAEMWESQQTVEMWADGDCGWIGSSSLTAQPTNATGGFAIALKLNR